MRITRTAIKSWMGSKIGKILMGLVELAALECKVHFPYTYNGGSVVSTLVRSFLQVTRTTVKAWMSELLPHLSPTTELAALECLKNQCIML